MGAHYTFECQDCGYKVEISGGKDRGDSICVQTMTCIDCKILVDVQVGCFQPSIVKGRETFFSEDALCPECYGTNLEAWEKGGPCPVCSGSMIRKEMVAIWD